MVSSCKSWKYLQFSTIFHLIIPANIFLFGALKGWKHWNIGKIILADIKTLLNMFYLAELKSGLEIIFDTFLF